MRLLRTGGIAVFILLLVWQCGGGDATETSTSNPDTTATTAAAPGTEAPVTGNVAPGPTKVTAALSPNKLPEPLYASNAASVANTVILAGGLDAKRTSRKIVWRFDPATGQTTNFAALPQPTRDAAVGVIGDRVYVAGGARGETTYNTVLSVTLIGELTPDGTMPTARSDGAAVTSEDGATIYIIGGYDGINPTNEVLSTTDGVTFTPVATLTQPVRNAAMVLINRSIWVIGGDWNDQELNTIFRIDLDPIGGAPAGTVTKVADLPGPLTRSAAANIGGTIFIVGGRSGGQPTAQILAFDPFRSSIADAGSLPAPTSDASIGVVNNVGYLLGGQNPNATDAIVTLTPA